MWEVIATIKGDVMYDKEAINKALQNIYDIDDWTGYGNSYLKYVEYDKSNNVTNILAEIC